MYVGKKLRLLRLQLDLNQEQIAESLGLSRSYYSAIELGKRKITKKMIENISKKWGINEGYFESKREQDYALKMRGYNEGGDEGGQKGTKNDGIEVLNEWQSRSIMGFEIEKTDEWITTSLRVDEQHKRVNFHYQRIVDIKILLDKTLKIKILNGYAGKEAKIMNSVFADGTGGVVRQMYSTTEELLQFENELKNLSKFFEKRFFELFKILYRGLRTDIKFKDKLPTEIE